MFTVSALIEKGKSLLLLIVSAGVVNNLFWISRTSESSTIQILSLIALLPFVVCAKWYRLTRKKLFFLAVFAWHTIFDLQFSSHTVSLLLDEVEQKPLGIHFYILSTVSLIGILLCFVERKEKKEDFDMEAFLAEDTDENS